MIVFAFLIGFCLGAYIATEMIDRFVVQKILRLTYYWRSEQVKARRDAVEAQKRWLDERNDEITKADWWKHTED